MPVAHSPPALHPAWSAYGLLMDEPPVLRWPCQLMAARSTAALPGGTRWAFEPKFDGFRGSSDVGRFVAGQEECGGRDLFGLAAAPQKHGVVHRAFRHLPRNRVGGHPLRHVGLDEAGLDDVAS